MTVSLPALGIDIGIGLRLVLEVWTVVVSWTWVGGMSRTKSGHKASL
jgi:hypothetical protein